MKNAQAAKWGVNEYISKVLGIIRYFHHTLTTSFRLLESSQYLVAQSDIYMHQEKAMITIQVTLYAYTTLKSA